jgi:hypothetical protein
LKEISVTVLEAPSTSAGEEKTSTDEKAKKKRKAPSKPSPRSEAEKRIEEIKNEVEKVLDRLGQMEIES